MAEQEISNHCRPASSCNSDSQKCRAFGSYIDHHQIGSKEDHCTSKVLGQYKDPYVKACDHSGLDHLFQVHIPP